MQTKSKIFTFSKKARISALVLTIFFSFLFCSSLFYVSRNDYWNITEIIVFAGAIIVWLPIAITMFKSYYRTYETIEITASEIIQHKRNKSDHLAFNEINSFIEGGYSMMLKLQSKNNDKIIRIDSDMNGAYEIVNILMRHIYNNNFIPIHNYKIKISDYYAIPFVLLGIFIFAFYLTTINELGPGIVIICIALFFTIGIWRESILSIYLTDKDIIRKYFLFNKSTKYSEIKNVLYGPSRNVFAAVYIYLKNGKMIHIVGAQPSCLQFYLSLKHFVKEML